MKKILVFGCSFSRGSYVDTSKSHIRNYDPWKKCDVTLTKFWAGDSVILGSKGWYHFVDYFKDKDITVIACPGQGYWTWYQVLLLLDKTNKLDYDEIWIQETWEPRVHIIQQKRTEQRLNDYTNWKDIDGITVIPIANQYLNVGYIGNHKIDKRVILYEDHDVTDVKSDAMKHITLKIPELFQEYCIKRNIEGYVWAMEKPTMNCTRFKRLLLTNNKTVLKKLKDKKLLCHPQGHQTEEGNKYIGELINKACIDMKI